MFSHGGYWFHINNGTEHWFSSQIHNLEIKYKGNNEFEMFTVDEDEKIHLFYLALIISKSMKGKFTEDSFMFIYDFNKFMREIEKSNNEILKKSMKIRFCGCLNFHMIIKNNVEIEGVVDKHTIYLFPCVDKSIVLRYYYCRKSLYILFEEDSETFNTIIQNLSGREYIPDVRSPKILEYKNFTINDFESLFTEK